MKTHLSILIFICLFIGKIYAQNERLYGAGKYSSEALTSNLITRMLQDDFGYIWIATDYGLNKFDGIRFIQYLHNEKDSTSLLSNNVRTLLMDKDNTIWIGCNEGLQYYLPNENCFRSIKFPENISPHITCIYQFSNGNIWVATSGWGIFSIDKNKGTAVFLEHITALTGDFCGYIYQDKELNTWININDKGIIKIDPDTREYVYYSKPDIPHNNIVGIAEDHNDNLYLATSTGICYYDKSQDKFIELAMDIPGISITDIFISRKGIIYVATDGQGIKYIDKEIQKLVSTVNERSVYNYSATKISALIEDRDQNLWIGCFLKGILMKPNEQTQFNFHRIFDTENQLGSTLNFIFKDQKGYLWVGTNQEGIIRINQHGQVVNRFVEKTDITSLYEDSEHRLWIGSYQQGLGTLDRKTGKMRFLNIPSKGYMKTIVEGADKHLYISTFGYGFMSYDIQTGKWEKFSMKQEDPIKGRLSNDWINAMICDAEGLIWMGHYKGISCYDPIQKRFITGKYNDLLASQICISLMEGKGGEIWSGTYNGLFRINKQTGEVKRYTVNNGLSSNVICGLAQDEKGNVWCSTFNGINHIKTDEDRIVNYYIGNGLMEKIYNRGVYFQEGSGTIYFGGNNGITSFNPFDSQISRYDHRIIVTNVYVNNQSVNVRTLSAGKPIIRTGLTDVEEFRFSYEDNTFTFEFSTMDFNSPENIYYEYRIKEFGSDWNTTLPGMNQITYNHLNPGTYTLFVRACKYGKYTPEKQLRIIISPPWHRTAIAYMVYLTIILCIGTLIVNLMRKRKNEKVNEAKLQFFINISHEIRSPLTLIINPIEKLLKGDFDPKTMKTLQVMHRNSTRILGLVNQLLDVRKIDKGQMKMNYSETDMDIFIKELMDIFEYQAVKRNIRLEFRNQTGSLSAWVDRSNFDKILMNLLSNAFKYTPDGGEIMVVLRIGMDNNSWGALRNYMEISVTDSGTGIEESEMDKIFERFYQGHTQETFTTIGSGIGLNLTQKLVQMHQGTITAANRKDVKGSCFIVRIPLGKDHIRKENFASIEVKKPARQKLFLPETAEKEKAGKRKTSYKVLVIDDEEEIRDYLKTELKHIYKVITAANGVDGLKMAISELPDLIISDVMMPEMDGFKLMNKLRNNPNVRHIPVILLTSKTEYEDRINALKKGADAYLTKPFNTEELLMTAGNLIASRKMLKSKFSGVQDQTDKIKTIKFKSSDEVLMERVMKHINGNIGNPEFNVEILASNVGLSRVQLHRKLKELTGLSSADFIRNIRLKQAGTLLKEKKVNITQVAYAVGFTNQTHFSTLFKKFYGVPPKDFIAQNKENTSGNENNILDKN